MLAQILITASIEPIDDVAPPLPDDKLSGAVLEAIGNAVKGGEQTGFEHELDGQTSIVITKVEPFAEDDDQDYCDECGATYPPEAKDMTGPWHASSCSLYEAPAGHTRKPDIQFESLGSIYVVQPLTKKGMDWVRHKLAFEQWQVVGGTGVAVESRTVDDLRQNATDDDLVVK
jgi:hypothetical protein